MERGERSATFTLQSMVLEYVTDRLVETGAEELSATELRIAQLAAEFDELIAVSDGLPGPQSQALRDHLLDIQYGRRQDPFDWMVEIPLP